ncbi:MAG: autotransporter outer membrane beta-barrel domain-containing protein [Puniceicoccales bacterium]|jgi:hypothetical protein|nr:autotransporter outer membrane beta-barrel domain-containing protein [Puniceicoccales bacterium]
MNMGRKKTFAILMATIGCLIFNFNLNAAGLDIVLSNFRAETIGEERLEGWTLTLSATLLATLLATLGAASETMSGESLTVTANNLLTDVLSNRMTNVKGCSAEPFVHAVYGHTHRKNVVAGYSYKNDTYGFVLGTDNVWIFADEKYFRLGVALGYVHGKTTPSSALSIIENISHTTSDVDLKQFDADFNHDIYVARLFGAYESFDDKCLKTNIGFVLGYSYGRDRFHISSLHFKFTSSGISLGVEFIKNLYAYEGYQFGLWFQANYGRAFQHMDMVDTSEEVPSSNLEAQSDFGHAFLATTIGLNMEKETFKHADKKLTFSLKAGWECRIIQSFNTHAVSVSIIKSDLYSRYTVSRYPRKNAAVLSFGASQKLNDHWSIAGSYSARFNKDLLAHGLSCGVEYAF